MSIKKRLEDYIAEAENSAGTGKKIGFDSLTSEEVNELLELADENGVIEMNGARIKLVKPGEQLPEEVKELLDSLDEEQLSNLRQPSLIELLSSKKAHENVDKLLAFLEQNNMDFVELLSAIVNISISGLSEDTIGLGGIENTNDYFNYIDEMQIEMRTTQTLLPTNHPFNPEDLVNASLLSALDTLTASKHLTQYMIRMHRMASLLDEERTKELASKKFESVVEMQRLAEEAEETEAVHDKIVEIFKTKTGLTPDEILEKLEGGTSLGDILGAVKERLKDTVQDMEIDNKKVC